MSYSIDSYVGDGTITQFAVTFPYLNPADVEVRLNGTLTTAFTWVSSGLIQLTTAPAAGVVVDIRRNTNKSTRVVQFQDASVLTESDLDSDSNQMFYIAQETLDAATNNIALSSDNLFDAQNKRIKNVADPIDDGDAATKGWITSTGNAVALAARDAALTYSLASANSATAAAESAALAANQVQLATAQANNAASSASSASSNAITVAAMANLQWAGFSVPDGELVVAYTDAAVSTPSLVDGEFIVTY